MNTILETAVIQEWMVRTLSQQYFLQVKRFAGFSLPYEWNVIIGVVCGNYFTGETTRIMWGERNSYLAMVGSAPVQDIWSATLFFLPIPITYRFLLLLLAR